MGRDESEDAVQEKLEVAIERRLREFVADQVGTHRQFLETMLLRLTWAIGVILALVLGTGVWLFGRSIDTAVDAGVNALLKEQTVAQRLRAQVTEQIAAQQARIAARVNIAVESALQDRASKDRITQAIDEKVGEIAKLSSDGLVDSAIRIPTGTVLAFDLDECPLGWTPYVPAVGRFIVGAGRGSNSDASGTLLSDRGQGSVGGLQVVTLTEANIPSHAHGFTGSLKLAGLLLNNAEYGTSPTHGGVPLHGNTNGGAPEGSRGPPSQVENMPPYVALTYCRKD